MEVCYYKTNSYLQETQDLLSHLEKSSNLSAEDREEIEQKIKEKFEKINSNFDQLDILASKVPLTMRQSAKMKVDQLKYDARHLSAAFDSWKYMNFQRQREASEREELLSRQFTTNDHVDIMIDHVVQHNTSVRNAVNGVDNMLEHGSDILDNLRSQRTTLRGAHKRLIDIGNTVGLSNTTMRLIEQRVKSDSFVFFGGIFVTILVLFIVVYYFL
ncbi:hypothetical protein TKK_0010423 [Trichogramma kaykai]|uniref:Golgi SNAP receptor complex member 2 n=1 Tax=Trichogramma kaykai TaxID=54128 RepID=A0ABD2WXS9_9HYME